MKVIVLAGATLVVGALWYLAHESKAGEQRPVAESRPVAAGRDVRQVPAWSRLSAPEGVETPVGQAAAQEEPAGARAEPPADPSAQLATQGAFLQARFEEQIADGQWAGAARAALFADLGRFQSKDVQVRDVVCRASLCRVELALGGEETGGAFMQGWLRARRWQGPGLAVPEPAKAGGAPSLIVFLGREGTNLPHAE